MSKRGLDPLEKETVEYYNSEAEWELRNEPPGTPGADLRFALSLKQNPKIIDVGCGYGRVIRHLREVTTFEYIGVDPAIEMLKIGRRLHPEIDFRQMSLYELPQQFPADSFDIALAITVLAHVTPVRMREALMSIRRVLKNDGVAFLTFMNGNQMVKIPSQIPGNDKASGIFCDWSLERIEPILKRVGFDPLRVSFYGNSDLYSIVAGIK